MKMTLEEVINLASIVEKGSTVIVISETESGWSKIRTENGKIGYVKTSKFSLN